MKCPHKNCPEPDQEFERADAAEHFARYHVVRLDTTPVNPTDLDSLLDECIWKQSEDNVTIRDYKEAKAAISAIIARACDKARIDELNKIRIVKKGADWTYFVKVYADQRIAQLKAEAVQKGETDGKG